jgi:Uma2 family endonuclease
MTVTERPPSIVATLDEVHRLSMDEYEEMVRCGALEGMRVELIDGYLLDMHAKSPGHENAIPWITEWLIDRIDRPRYQVRTGASLRIGNSEPEPDIMVAERSKPKDRHPTSSPFVAEVAHTSRQRDLTLKPVLYSAAVSDYWVVDLDERIVVVHRDPGPDGYRTATTYTPEQALAPQLLPDQPMSFGELFAAI